MSKQTLSDNNPHLVYYHIPSCCENGKKTTTHTNIETPACCCYKKTNLTIIYQDEIQSYFHKLGKGHIRLFVGNLYHKTEKVHKQILFK